MRCYLKKLLNFVKSAFLSINRIIFCYIYSVGHSRPRRCKKRDVVNSKFLYIVVMECPVLSLSGLVDINSSRGGVQSPIQNEIYYNPVGW